MRSVVAVFRYKYVKQTEEVMCTEAMASLAVNGIRGILVSNKGNLNVKVICNCSQRSRGPLEFLHLPYVQPGLTNLHQTPRPYPISQTLAHMHRKPDSRMHEV